MCAHSLPQPEALGADLALPLRLGGRLIARGLIEEAAVRRRAERPELCVRGLAARKARHLMPGAAQLLDDSLPDGPRSLQ
jgi:hypothetical protein